MKKAFVVLLSIMLAYTGFAQKSVYPERYLWNRPNRYTMALTVANPLGVMTKYGGGLEYRHRNFAYMASYYRYKFGAYPGASYDLDMRVYMKNRWIITRRKWSYQNFIYWRGFVGFAGFNGDKLAMFGYPKNVYWPQHAVFTGKITDPGEGYYGASAGYGRRYNKGPFFIAIKTGLRATKLIDLDPDGKGLYRLFYVTGPGSILELNIQMGLQIF